MGGVLAVSPLEEKHESFWHLGMADRRRIDGV
jgi:hypothetical protein